MAGDAHQPWAIAQAESLRNRFLRIVTAYSRHIESKDRCGEAVELYRKLIEIDPVAEDLYQGLMNCFLNLGRQAEGIKVYRSCSRVLDEVLGTGPSAKTEEICRQLRSMS
jgi:DNA-binding SARP family transcriptional activator